MPISAALKTRFPRLLKRISSDRGNIGLTVMVGTVLMMLATYAAVKALAPALHTIAARSDIRRAGTLSNLANSYIAQTGDMQPTIAKLVSSGLLPATSKGVCASCGGVGTYTTNDGSVLSMVSGASPGIFGMTLVPGPNMARDMNFYLSHLTGSVQNGSTVAWNQPVPAIANLGTRFVQTNPANPGATQVINSPVSTTGSINTNGNWAISGATSTGYISSGTITTNGNPIYSGSVNTGNISSGSIYTNGSAVNAGPVFATGVYTGGLYANNFQAGGGPYYTVWQQQCGTPGSSYGCGTNWGYLYPGQWVCTWAYFSTCYHWINPIFSAAGTTTVIRSDNNIQVCPNCGD
ncbi:MAG: hypothetical protein ACYDBP_08605 [Leptospirales bacterium]